MRTACIFALAALAAGWRSDFRRDTDRLHLVALAAGRSGMPSDEHLSTMADRFEKSQRNSGAAHPSFRVMQSDLRARLPLALQSWVAGHDHSPSSQDERAPAAPSQGFEGKDVQHETMKTSTGDFRSEYGPKADKVHAQETDRKAVPMKSAASSLAAFSLPLVALFAHF
eukprot:gnl/TRDRNA2_/TRDRNA2_188484_c0_seq1.p1 gnl/TRDRNA2_/TRDRNA2_188484_c0~~gnl/TRDRNA2_/TRDRNA2_188484_c0_seq1.p1  ORF type:complete len:169 (+),score=21.68 gnl/TRDRNA2_/TRDRNA2_188484_c0_seq1:132-638(+)